MITDATGQTKTWAWLTLSCWWWLSPSSLQLPGLYWVSSHSSLLSLHLVPLLMAAGGEAHGLIPPTQRCAQSAIISVAGLSGTRPPTPLVILQVPRVHILHIWARTVTPRKQDLNMGKNKKAELQRDGTPCCFIRDTYKVYIDKKQAVKSGPFSLQDIKCWRGISRLLNG